MSCFRNLFWVRFGLLTSVYGVAPDSTKDDFMVFSCLLAYLCCFWFSQIKQQSPVLVIP